RRGRVLLRRAGRPVAGRAGQAGWASSGGPPVMPASRIIRVDAAGTLALVLVTVLASAVTSGTTGALNLLVSGVLFLGGCVAFAVGFVRAADRSRTEVIDLAGLFYLTGAGPTPERRAMLGLWFVQI